MEYFYWFLGGWFKFEVFDVIFVKIEIDVGVIGWGEGIFWGYIYVFVYGLGICVGIEIMIFFVIGFDFWWVLDVECVMDFVLLGYFYVKFFIDMVCWDIVG